MKAHYNRGTRTPRNHSHPTRTMPNESSFWPRDFVETAEGLLFAVVDAVPEQGKVLAFLRYHPAGKLSTAVANTLLTQHHPHYLHYSPRLDARLHAVPIESIVRHHKPRERLQQMLRLGPADDLEDLCLRLVGHWLRAGLSADCLGVTGSLLLGRQRPGSDLDLVVYGREAFFRARTMVRTLIDSGHLHALDERAWRESFERRDCELGYVEFIHHERRKYNKGLIGGSKFDLALIVEEPAKPPETIWRKMGSRRIQARLLDDRRTYDQPAHYPVDHPQISEVLSFTHTYVGQAKTGEWIEAVGAVETADDGRQRLIVGSSREAPGEFIRSLSWLESLAEQD